MTENEFKLYLALGLCAPGVWGGQKEATMYSYNGVVLPKLPEWDKTAYPYAILYHPGFLSIYDETKNVLMVSDSTFIFNGSQYRPNGDYKTGKSEIEIDAESTWSDFTYHEYNDADGGFYKSVAKVYWSNHDILNDDGTIHLSASDPVPVYE